VAERYTGASVQRVEDRRILTGRGRYVDDLRATGMLHAAFFRSPLPHGVIRSIDVSVARAMPGVHAVFTGADLAAAGVGRLQIGIDVPGASRPSFEVLTSDKVRMVGDPLALVVAESRYLAEDALQHVLLDVDPLPAVTTPDDALAPDAPVVLDGLDSNIIAERVEVVGDVEEAFAAADHVVRIRVHQARLTNVPLEGRNCLADWDSGRGELTYQASSQHTQRSRMLLSAVLGVPLERVRSIVGDTGGSFGQKAPIPREHVAVCFASMKLARPVKWIEDRVENLMAGGQARDETVEAAAAVQEDGTILALDVDLTLDHGSYPAVPTPAAVPLEVMRVMLPSGLRVSRYRFSHRMVATNKAQWVPYRGPWAIETLVREMLLDRIAGELGLSPAEVRLQNLVTSDEQPVRMVTGPTLDRVTLRETLARTLELIDEPAFREFQASERAQGRYHGLGIATFIEPSPGPPDYGEAIGMGPLLGAPDRTRARIEPDGRLTLFISQVPHGQSHETTLAQLGADGLGVPFESVRVLYGDSREMPFAVMGTGGSRAATMASGSALAASRSLKKRVLELAAQLLEIAPEDLDLADGVVSAKGAPARSLGLAEIAQRAYFAPPPGFEVGLEVTEGFTQPSSACGWGQATHACTVEVDTETGLIAIRRYVVVEDCGSIVNPAVVDGQIRGGVAQGVGAALLESFVYDEDGQPLSTTLMDYMLPTAAEIPNIEIEHLESEAPGGEDFRGVGEGGLICAPATIVNAVTDALSPFSVVIDRLPLSPSRVLELLGTI
jgi:carbon-monoxide dehydrogenase large subunit